MRSILALVLLSISVDSFAMLAEPTRLAVWRKGESIAGEEFIAMNESIVDYLATLKRPADASKAIKYDCQGKSRLIRPSVFRIGSGLGGNETEWVYVRAVYELKDCVEVP
jgi:hypothetical protein